jgi:PAB-dependent poly(A)-specific ribonuclease subunit 2
VDYGRENAEVDYAQKIQTFHRFLIDHLTAEGNSFPSNPRIVNRTEEVDQQHLVGAPITQLLGVDAKNVIVCQSCKATREKENMTHIIDLNYPRKVRFSESRLLFFHADVGLRGAQRVQPPILHRFFRLRYRGP